MHTYEIVIAVIAVIASLVLTIAFVTVFIMSLSGKDLAAFNRYKTAAPKQYRNIKWVCRINGAMVALMSVGFILSSPMIALDPEGGVLLAIGTVGVFAMFLWLSVRWFLWSLHA